MMYLHTTSSGGWRHCSNLTIVSLIAVQRLVFLSLGPEGNNGVMGKILRAVTSFGFRDVFRWTNRGALWCVCVSVHVCVLFW